MSRNPAVVASTTFAVRPVSSAFVATVVPWKIIRMAAGTTPCAASEASARSNARPGSSGVDGTLAISTRPSEVVAIASVKVPPMSMPTTQPGSLDSARPVSATAACPGQFPDSRHHLAGEQVKRPALQVPWQAGEVEPGNEVQVAAGCLAVPVDLASDLRRRAEHDRSTQCVFFRGRQWRGRQRVAFPGSRGLHVVVLPGDVAVIVADQLPRVLAVPGEDRQVDTDRERGAQAAGRPFLTGGRHLAGQRVGRPLVPNDAARPGSGPRNAGIAGPADPQWRAAGPGGPRPHGHRRS